MAKAKKKLTERQLVNAIVDGVIIPRFGGRHNLHGDIGKLRKMSLKKVVSYAKRYAVITEREAKQLLNSKRLKRKK